MPPRATIHSAPAAGGRTGARTRCYVCCVLAHGGRLLSVLIVSPANVQPGHWGGVHRRAAHHRTQRTWCRNPRPPHAALTSTVRSPALRPPALAAFGTRPPSRRTHRPAALPAGDWIVEIHAVGGKGLNISVHGEDGPVLTATGVQFGDVYFCGGQSNMVSHRRAVGSPLPPPLRPWTEPCFPLELKFTSLGVIGRAAWCVLHVGACLRAEGMSRGTVVEMRRSTRHRGPRGQTPCNSRRG